MIGRKNELTAGELLCGKYVILSKAGEGGYSCAYLARRLEDQQVVLVKIAKKIGRKTRKSFERESRILSLLENKGAPGLYEFINEEDACCLVIEYKKGSTFEDLIFEDGCMYTESESIVLLNRIIEELAPIHSHGIVHRDLRIPNILLYKGDVSIIDFGLAGSVNEKAIFRLSRNRKRFREFSFKSDFYSLGHLLLFLLYSSYPEHEEKERPWEEELCISPATRKITRKLLQLDEPYDKMEELQNDLIKWGN
ncbi:serine/threonine protein kinase [Metabacillus sp. 84]|uniref:serine/threonine protein kinase n=1 Tax=Metabacillus sp. 84 TaxID=3404705 RepID=UPI003CF74C06